MSTCYRLRGWTTINQIKANLPKGWSIYKDEETGKEAICDGTNYLYMYPFESGRISGFERYGGNDPTDIIKWIESLTGKIMISEYDENFFN